MSYINKKICNSFPFIHFEGFSHVDIYAYEKFIVSDISAGDDNRLIEPMINEAKYISPKLANASNESLNAGYSTIGSIFKCIGQISEYQYDIE